MEKRIILDFSFLSTSTITNKFICQPVTEPTLEVKPKELSSVYGVECVQILDAIAFDDDDVEDYKRIIIIICIYLKNSES